jgi:putative FmdB family regulatory protein
MRASTSCRSPDPFDLHHEGIILGMPIYEYRCEECGKKSSALLASFSSPDPACPHCGKPGLRRLVSTFATVSSGDDGGDDFGGGDDYGGDDMGGGDEGFGGDDGGGGGYGDDDF